jgi:hypothetical protein
MRPVKRVAASLAVGLLWSATAGAQPRRPQTGQPAPAAAPALAPGTVVALAPLAALGSDGPARGNGKLEAALAAELSRAGVTVVAPAAIAAKVESAKVPALRACDGDDGCLADVGTLVGARAVIAGEVGGLGDVQVVYLELVDVATRAEVRRAQAPLGGGALDLRAAVIRLVDPARDTGTLQVTSPIDGAVVYVDGRRIGATPLAPMTLPVGAHALRVTHPDARDYVRYVDVDFERTTAIAAELARFASIDTAVSATGAPAGATLARGAARDPAWYRRWWAVAGFSAVVLGGAIIAGTALADDVDASSSGTVDPP